MAAPIGCAQPKPAGTTGCRGSDGLLLYSARQGRAIAGDRVDVGSSPIPRACRSSTAAPSATKCADTSNAWCRHSSECRHQASGVVCERQFDESSDDVGTSELSISSAACSPPCSPTVDCSVSGCSGSACVVSSAGSGWLYVMAATLRRGRRVARRDGRAVGREARDGLAPSLPARGQSRWRRTRSGSSAGSKGSSVASSSSAVHQREARMSTRSSSVHSASDRAKPGVRTT
jgi:hypothetical protein